MDAVVWVVLGAILVASLVMIGVESRIMHKPDAERSDRERAFLRHDRAAARGYQTYSRNVAPWIVVGLSALGILLVLPLWFTQRAAIAAVLTALFVVLAGAIMGLRVFLVRRRGPAWRQAQDEANHDADVAGRPRWFASVRSGLLLGAGFFAVGVIFVVVGLATGHFNWWSVAMLPPAVLIVVLALVQRRGESRSRPTA